MGGDGGMGKAERLIGSLDERKSASALCLGKDQDTHSSVALVDGRKASPANLFMHGVVAQSLSPTA